MRKAHVTHQQKIGLILSAVVITLFSVFLLIIIKNNTNTHSNQQTGTSLSYTEQSHIERQVKIKGVEAQLSMDGKVKIIVSAGARTGGPSRTIEMSPSGVKLKDNEIAVDVTVNTIDTMETSISNPQLAITLNEMLPRGSYKITADIHERDGFSQKVNSTESFSTTLNVK